MNNVKVENGDGWSGLDLLIALARHRRLVIWVPAVAAVVAAGLSLILPQTFLAATKIMPPQQPQSMATALLSQFGAGAGVAAGITGLKSPNDLYVGMLKSRTIADRLITRFDLKKHYELESLELARRRLAGETVITAGKDGLISVEVESRDRKLAAPLANAYVEELSNLSSTLAVTEAAKRRLFFEQQLERAKNALANAEAKLKSTLDTKGMVSVDTESRALLGVVAQVRAQISAKEIQLSSMSAFLTAANPQYRQVQEELASLRAELSRLESGRSSPARAAAPEKDSSGLANIQVLRDIKYHQMLYELLSKQYEIARMDEAKDAALIQVLDIAVEPERKHKPKRLLLVAVSAFAALFGAILFALIAEARRRSLQRPERAARWMELKESLRARTSRPSM